MAPQATLEVYGGYEWTSDLFYGDYHNGSIPTITGTETGASTALPIGSEIVPTSLYKGGFVQASWSISATTQHFDMSAIAAGYGINDPMVEADDGYATTTVFVGSDSLDYITNTSTAPVTVKFTYTLNAEAQTGELQEADCRYQVGGVSGTIDLIPTGGSGTGTYEATIAAGQTVAWATYYTFEGDATWGYDPGTGFTGSDFTYDASSTGHVYADELDSSGNPIAGNPDLVFASGINFSSISCFVSETLIAVPSGHIAVEQLHVGDLIRTAFSGVAPVKWLGYRRVDCRRHPKPEDIWPVRIMAGAFGPSMPYRDLWLSPDHAVFAEEVLIPVKHLINGSTIAQEERDEVTYWHVELARHDVLMAEGLPCESYLDTGTRSSFANGGSVVQMHADFGGNGTYCEAVWEAVACAPLRIHGDAVDRVAARLRDRATKLGHAPGRGTMAASRTCPTTIDVSGLLRPLWYLAANSDVARAGVDAATHYMTYGRQEGRLPCPEVELLTALGLVDPATVAFTMPDIIAAGVNPVEHFCHTGWCERRRPNLYFDTGWYSDTHGVPAGTNPLVHYVLRGERQGLPPGPHFDPAWYRKRYAIGPTESPLAHYLKHRRARCFSPLPTFDVAAYVEAHAATVIPTRDPYAHFLAVGQFAAAGEDQAAAMAA